MAPSEQRREPRKTLQVRFKARETSGTGVLWFESADLSSGGAFLKSELLLEDGEPLEVTFEAPEGPQTTRARVAWVRRFPAGDQLAGMGLEFLGLTQAQQLALERWLR